MRNGNGNGAKHERREVSLKRLDKIAAVASAKAIKRTHALGLPITVLENDEIVRVFPDGRREFVKKLEIEKHTLIQKRIVLK